LDTSGSGYEPVAGPYEHGNKFPSPLKAENLWTS